MWRCSQATAWCQQRRRSCLASLCTPAPLAGSSPLLLLLPTPSTPPPTHHQRHPRRPTWNFSASSVADMTTSLRSGRCFSTSLSRPNSTSVASVRSCASSRMITLRAGERGGGPGCGRGREGREEAGRAGSKGCNARPSAQHNTQPRPVPASLLRHPPHLYFSSSGSVIASRSSMPSVANLGAEGGGARPGRHASQPAHGGSMRVQPAATPPPQPRL